MRGHATCSTYSREYTRTPSTYVYILLYRVHTPIVYVHVYIHTWINMVDAIKTREHAHVHTDNNTERERNIWKQTSPRASHSQSEESNGERTLRNYGQNTVIDMNVKYTMFHPHTVPDMV